MISGQWCYKRRFFNNWPKSHKITHNSMKNRGSTLIVTNLVGVHTKSGANPCSGSREEVEKTKKVHTDDNDDDDGHRMINKVTLTR